MRHYVISCLHGTSAVPMLHEVWACGVIEAFDRCKASGLWPLAVVRSDWEDERKK